MTKLFNDKQRDDIFHQLMATPTFDDQYFLGMGYDKIIATWSYDPKSTWEITPAGDDSVLIQTFIDGELDYENDNFTEIVCDIDEIANVLTEYLGD